MSLTNDSPEVAAAAAKTASFTLASLPASARNEALEAIHAALTASKDEILAANARDLELAQKAAADGMLSQALVSRLDLGKKGKFEDMLQGILDVRDLEDPGTWYFLLPSCNASYSLFPHLYLLRIWPFDGPHHHERKFSPRHDETWKSDQAC